MKRQIVKTICSNLFWKCPQNYNIKFLLPLISQVLLNTYCISDDALGTRYITVNNTTIPSYIIRNIQRNQEVKRF